MLIRFYEKNPSQRDIDRVLDILNGGGVIVFPTDTAYALGCHALKERPIERICKIKGMNPQKHRFSIVCYDLSDISQSFCDCLLILHPYGIPQQHDLFHGCPPVQL